jgi:hypothetical protein
MKIVRFLLGQCYALDGWALNDVEAMLVGDVAVGDPLLGSVVNGACLFDQIILTVRPQ